MKYRRLFQARDEKGILREIEHLTEAERSQRFTCPFCAKQVIARTGSHNAWHFSHKDRVCDSLKEKKVVDSAQTSGTPDIFSFTDKVVSSIDFSLDPGSFMCELCRKVSSREQGIKWNETVFLCRDCFGNLNDEKIQSLLWKTIDRQKKSE